MDFLPCKCAGEIPVFFLLRFSKLHCLQLCGFFPEWELSHNNNVSLQIFRLAEWFAAWRTHEGPFSTVSGGWFCSGSGLNDCSPRWATKWILRFEAWLNDLLHSGAFPSHCCEKESWIQVLLFFLLNSSFCGCLGVKARCLFCCCWIGALWTPAFGFSPAVWISMWAPRFSAKIEGFYILHNVIFPRIHHKMSSHRSSLGG